MPKIKLILPAILAGIILGGAGCSLFTENTLIDLKNEDKKEVIAESNSEVPTEVGDTSDWIEFTSQNGKIKFSYNSEWKCTEIMYTYRFTCYPKTREIEEYDYGMDVPNILNPEISIINENKDCKWDVDQDTVNGSPYHFEPEDIAPPHNIFYKKIHECEVKIATHNDIDTNEKLNEIIQIK